jgi:plasmid stabilization system protein ParE
MAYLVRTMPRAERDMEAIFLYIQAESSMPASRWFEGLVEAIESLSEHPQRNPTIIEDPTLRHLLYGNKPHIYRIIYSIDLAKKVVSVIHVRHRARDAFEPDEPR